MSELRLSIDKLEGMLPKEQWPLASYAEMLFII
jgi:glutamine synthetase type III